MVKEQVRLIEEDVYKENIPENSSGKNEERIYFPELDGLRFLAFILVFIHHQSLFGNILYISKIKGYGWVGVDLFFALSAFLFTKLLTAEYYKTHSISFKKFYLRRIFRIWPLYFVFIGFAVSYFIFYSNGELSKNIYLRIFGLVAFSDNIFTALKGYNPLPYTSHLWTIAYEEQFYVFIPLVIWLLVRASAKTKVISLISVLLIFFGIRHALIVMNIPHPAIWVLPVTHFESIIFGIVVGFGGFDFLLKVFKPLTLGMISILFITIVCILPSVNVISSWLHVSYLCVGIFTSLVLFSVLKSDILKTVFSLRVFVFLGKRSYGLYVYHLLGNGVAEYIIKKIPAIPSNTLADFLYSLTFTIIAAIVSYSLIEKPFLKLKRKFEVVISRPI